MSTELSPSSGGQGGSDRPLKILQIHNHYREGGGEDTVVAKEAALLRSAGHTVVELRASNPTDSLSTATSLLIAPWNPAAAHRIQAAVLESEPDVAHVHNTWWALSPSILRSLERAGVPVVMTLHNYRLLCANAQLFRDGHPCEECVGTHPWRGVQYRCYRDSTVASFMAAGTIALNRRLATWETVQVFLALTEFARGRFVAGGLPEGRLLIKPNFVDDPGARVKPPSESSTVLYVGRISGEKGVDLLLEAWSLAAIRNLELVLVGDGPLRASLQVDPPPGVRFLGARPPDEVQQLMLGARALVFPSVWYEGQPMVLLEGLAAGLPILASDIGGIAETLQEAGSGMLAFPGIASDWSAGLTRLLDSPQLDLASRISRRVYQRDYSPGSALGHLANAYQTAIRSG